MIALAVPHCGDHSHLEADARTFRDGTLEDYRALYPAEQSPAGKRWVTAPCSTCGGNVTIELNAHHAMVLATIARSATVRLRDAAVFRDAEGDALTAEAARRVAKVYERRARALEAAV